MKFREEPIKCLAIHFARLGPYHVARLRTAAEVLNPLGWQVIALETAGDDATYAWEKTDAGMNGFEQRTVFTDRVFESIPAAEMRGGISRVLGELNPDAIAVAGWGTVDARACLSWCKRNKAKAIVMSETRAADGRRIWWKEWLKSRIVRQFDAALCGGESHRRYLMQLGIPRERIAFGYNVVDNKFFGEIRSRDEFSVGSFQCSGTEKEHEQNAGPYFLASNRFVKRKNLGRLIRAYAGYVEGFQSSAFSFHQAAGEIWPLVLLGDGELRGELEALCEELGIKAFSFQGSVSSRVEKDDLKLNFPTFQIPVPRGLVVFAGFRQIAELPAFYAGAGAFVHPALEEPWGLVINEAMASGLPVLSSNNVGAAEELVVHGETGFLFDSKDEAVLGGYMRQVAELPEEARRAMGRAAREMVEHKAPLRSFGEGLAKLLA